jgi:putative membrane protein
VSKTKVNKTHIIFLVIFIAILIWSLIKPKEGYGIWAVEVLPSLIINMIIVITYQKFRFTTLSYFIITLLSMLTLIGGHYSYSQVPIFDWIKDTFHFERNHYDRFGHFLKGLIVIVIKELLVRKTPLVKGKIVSIIAICISLAISAIYEIVEWLSTRIKFGNKKSNDFLGMQGDQWDPQWDMALLLIGSILAVLFLSKYHNNKLSNLKDN